MLTHKNKELSSLDSLRVIFQECQKLDLSENHLKTLNGIEEAGKSLTWLKAANNLLTDVKALKSCVNVTVLNLSSNKLRKIGAINHLKGLKALILNNNELSTFDKPLDFPELNTIVLSQNNIEDIDLSRLPNLMKVSCSSNQLKEFPNLKKNKLVQEVRLNKNKIKMIPSCITTSCKKLKLMDIGNNCIEDFSTLTQLKSLPSLESLNVKGNPVCDTENPKFNETSFILEMKEILPNIKILDYRNFATCYYDAVVAKEKQEKDIPQKQQKKSQDKKSKIEVELMKDEATPSRGFKSSRNTIVNDKQSEKTNLKKHKNTSKKKRHRNDVSKDVTSVECVKTSDESNTNQAIKTDSQTHFEQTDTNTVEASTENDVFVDSTSKKESRNKTLKKKKRKRQSEDKPNEDNIPRKRKKDKKGKSEKREVSKSGRSGVVSRKTIKTNKISNSNVLSELVSVKNVGFGEGLQNKW